MQVRVESEGGSDRARSLSRCPAAHLFPFGRGRNGSSRPPGASSAPGLGEGRRGRRAPSRRRPVGSEKRRRWGGGRGNGASSGLSAGSVESGAWQLGRFLCVRSPSAPRVALFWEAVPTPGRGPRSSRLRDPEKSPFRAAYRATSARLGGLRLSRISLPPRRVWKEASGVRSSGHGVSPMKRKPRAVAFVSLRPVCLFCVAFRGENHRNN